MSIRHVYTLLVLSVMLVSGSRPGAAVEVTLQNDSFSSGLAAFQAGFAEGEIAAARFEPDGPFPMPLHEVRFLFGDVAAQAIVVLHVWEDGAGTRAPGAELFSESYQVMGSTSSFAVIDLRSAGIEIQGPFRVGIEFFTAGLPSVARDTDGTIATANNFIYALGIGWIESSLLGLTGDWVIRAVVDVPSTAADPAPSRRVPLAVTPNPFNPSSQVRIELPSSGPVTLRVYDVRGRQVDSLLEGSVLAPGVQTIPYRARLGSGVYLLRGWGNGWWASTKFTVLK
jgi:hypothetical protein